MKFNLNPCFSFLFVLVLSTFLCNEPKASSENSQQVNFLKITVSPAIILIGETFTVFVESANSLKSIELTAFNKKQKIYRIWHKDHKHVYRAFLGVSLKQKPGIRKIRVHAIDKNDEPIQIYSYLKVNKGNYKVQNIKLTKKKSKLLNYESLNAEGRILGSRFRRTDKKVYFASHFIRPAKGRISSPFGARRKYNDDQFSSFHKGMDFANKVGTHVKAANGGKISLAQHMESNGKIILINHGHGVTSIYSHLEKILVKEGDWVKKGQLIGHIGSTGISTGPHLHFGISVNNVRVNPDQWLRSRVRLYYNVE